MSSFVKARRTEARARIGISGPSGSGKTMGALIMALGLTGDAEKIAVIDTENGSASLYDDVPAKLGFKGTFFTSTMRPPYTVEKAQALLKEAEGAGFECIILDSITHYWDGEGGLLDRKDRVQSKDSYTAWRTITPLHDRFVGSMLHSPAHIIATMRTKTAYDLEKGADGKIKPVKIGLKPVVREGLDYEFTVVFDITRESHTATASKDRTGLFDESVHTPGPISLETAHKLNGWLKTAILDGPAAGKDDVDRALDEAHAEAMAEAEEALAPPPQVYEAIAVLQKKATAGKLNFDGIRKWAAMDLNIPQFERATVDQLRVVKDKIMERVKADRDEFTAFLSDLAA